MSFRLARSLPLLAVSLVAAGPLRAEAAATLPPVVGAAERQASDWRSGLGLSGYDPVAVLLEGRLQPGSAAHEALHAGLAWRFVSEANRAAFRRDPEAFLPRAGGYDALAAGTGRIVAADPTLFLAQDGRLYVFRTAESRRLFQADADAAGRAEARWPELWPTLVAE